MAQEIMKGELDLFRRVAFQGSIDNSQIIQYRPVTALAASSTIQFDIPISADEYLDLQNVYLWIKGKLTDSAGVNFVQAQDDRYSLVNYALNTMFDQLTIHLDSTQISQSSNTYHYLSYIEAITQNNYLTTETFLNSSGFVSYFGQNNVNFDGIDDRLHSMVTRSKNFTLYGKMHNGIFNSDRLLLNGITLRIELHRATNEFATIGLAAVAGGAAAATPIINLRDISVFVRKVKLVPSILSAHAKALSSRNAVYPIKRSE